MPLRANPSPDAAEAGRADGRCPRRRARPHGRSAIGGAIRPAARASIPRTFCPP